MFLILLTSDIFLMKRKMTLSHYLRHRLFDCPTRPRRRRRWGRSWIWCQWMPSASWTWWHTSTPSGPAPSRSLCHSTSCGRHWGLPCWPVWGSWFSSSPSTLWSPTKHDSCRSVGLVWGGVGVGSWFFSSPSTHWLHTKHDSCRSVGLVWGGVGVGVLILLIPSTLWSRTKHDSCRLVDLARGLGDVI